MATTNVAPQSSDHGSHPNRAVGPEPVTTPLGISESVGRYDRPSSRGGQIVTTAVSMADSVGGVAIGARSDFDGIARDGFDDRDGEPTQRAPNARIAAQATCAMRSVIATYLCRRGFCSAVIDRVLSVARLPQRRVSRSILGGASLAGNRDVDCVGVLISPSRHAAVQSRGPAHDKRTHAVEANRRRSLEPRVEIARSIARSRPPFVDLVTQHTHPRQRLHGGAKGSHPPPLQRFAQCPLQSAMVANTVRSPTQSFAHTVRPAGHGGMPTH